MFSGYCLCLFRMGLFVLLGAWCVFDVVLLMVLFVSLWGFFGGVGGWGRMGGWGLLGLGVILSFLFLCLVQ